MNERRGKRDVYDEVGGGGSGGDGDSGAGADDDCITYSDKRGVSRRRDRGLGTTSGVTFAGDQLLRQLLCFNRRVSGGEKCGHRSS